MGRLIVIGNGFDLWHGLPTCLSDFTDIIWAQQGSDEIRDNEEIESLHAFLDHYVPTWGGWEQWLGDIDARQVHADLAVGPDYLSDRESDRDFGVERIDQVCNWLVASINGAFAQMVDAANAKLATLPESAQESPFKEGDRIVTFNYTDTIEIRYPTPAPILHIHGRHAAGDTLRYGWTPGARPEGSVRCLASPKPTAEELEYGSFDEDPYVYKQGQIVDDMINAFEKRLQIEALTEFLDGFGADEVFVLGHGLELVDHEYFELIEQRVAPRHWYVSQHNDQPNEDTVNQYSFAARVHRGDLGTLMDALRTNPSP